MGTKVGKVPNKLYKGNLHKMCTLRQKEFGPISKVKGDSFSMLFTLRLLISKVVVGQIPLLAVGKFPITVVGQDRIDIPFIDLN